VSQRFPSYSVWRRKTSNASQRWGTTRIRYITDINAHSHRLMRFTVASPTCRQAGVGPWGHCSPHHRCAPLPVLTAPFYEAPHVNPKALDLHSLIQSVGVLPVLSAGGVSTVSSAADRQRVDYRASLCVLSSHSTQRPVSIRVGTAGALTTFYPCRLAAGHLISHAPLGAGDTSKQCAPSTKSVRLATRMRYGHIPPLDTAPTHGNAAAGNLHLLPRRPSTAPLLAPPPIGSTFIL